MKVKLLTYLQILCCEFHKIAGTRRYGVPADAISVRFGSCDGTASAVRVRERRFCRLKGGMLWRFPCDPTSSVRSRDVARGRGVEGRRAEDGVGHSPTAAADHRGRHCRRGLACTLSHTDLQ